MKTDRSDWPQWARLYAARFRAYSDFDWESWEDVLRADLRVAILPLAEIAATLEWMQGPEVRWKACETAHDLVRAIYTRRKAMRSQGATETAHEAGSDGPCARCGVTGWDHMQREDGSLVSVPCCCGAGAALWVSVRPYKDMSPDELSDLRAAIESARARQCSTGGAA